MHLHYSRHERSGSEPRVLKAVSSLVLSSIIYHTISLHSNNETAFRYFVSERLQQSSGCASGV